MDKREGQQVARSSNLSARWSVCAGCSAFVAALIFVLCLIPPQSARSQSVPLPIATHVSIAGSPSSTQFVLDLTASIAAEVYTLADPYRVVIDMPETTSSVTARQTATGLVKSYRAQLLNSHGTRLIIETAGPVEIAGVDWIGADDPKSASAARLQLTLTPMDRSAFGKGTGYDIAEHESSTPPNSLTGPAAAKALTQPALAKLSPTTLPAVTTLAKSPVKPALFDDSVTQLQAVSSTKPIVMIDPGHGGIDPGAIGIDKVTEKTIVLAVANQAKLALESTGRYDVRLTRTTDVFIPLDSRVALSKQAKADIFISLHADTIENRQHARSVRGASVYTLSDKASNEDARIMAEKENAADLVAGITPRTSDSGDDIKPILFDLMARETATFSRLLSRSLIAALRKNHPMTHEPERAAAFRVLRQPHAPSVLIELGFLSNPDEEQLMTKAAWQKQAGASIAAAVDTYFSRKASTAATAPLEGDFGGLPP